MHDGLSTTAPVEEPILAFPTIQGRFAFRITVWMACFVTLVAAWGGYNGWPPELGMSLMFLPWVGLFAIWQYRRLGIGLRTPDRIGEWPMLIAYLLLAIGIASGTLLLMALGWMAVGALCLHPVSRRAPWDEWLKIPALLVFAFPVELDLAGVPHAWLAPWITGFGAHATVYAEEGAMSHMAFGRVAMLIAAATLRGPVFWVACWAAPILMLGAGWAVRRLPLGEAPLWSEVAGWTLAASAFGAAFLGARRFAGARGLFRQSWAGFSDLLGARTYSIWIAAVAVMMQQSALIEGWQARVYPLLSLVEVAFLGGLLFWVRSRQSESPVEDRSRLWMVSSLFLLLAGEWTDLDVVRHVAFGLLVGAIFSWRRSWPHLMILPVAAAWIALLPAGSSAPAVDVFLGGFGVAARGLLFLTGAAGIYALAARLPRESPHWKRPDEAWQPVKRFAFTLLLLLIACQGVSALWPGSAGPADQFPFEPRPAVSPGFERVRPELAGFRARATRSIAAPSGRSARVLVAQLAPEPVKAVSPEWIFRLDGWEVEGRRIVPHPKGRAALLELKRGEARATAICWFENRDQAFPGHQRARAVLWSGWNLTRRNVRLVAAWFEEASADEAVEAAREALWFRSFVREASSLPPPEED